MCQAAHPRKLICSIHDVGPRFEREVDILAELFDHALGAARFAMPVVPDHWGEAKLAEAPDCGPVVTWASRSVPRQWSSRAFARIARAAPVPLPVVRLAVHPRDTRVDTLMNSISGALAGSYHAPRLDCPRDTMTNVIFAIKGQQPARQSGACRRSAKISHARIAGRIGKVANDGP